MQIPLHMYLAWPTIGPSGRQNSVASEVIQIGSSAKESKDKIGKEEFKHFPPHGSVSLLQRFSSSQNTG